MSENGEKEPHDASLEVKRGRGVDEGESEELANKKKPSSNKDTSSKEGPTTNTRQRQESPPYLGENTTLPKDNWKERMGNMKEKWKDDEAKGKGMAPAYILQSDIESLVDMKGIMEERILDAKIEFTLREALGIAKKDFHELIIEVIKRKKQMTADTVMARALIDTLMSEVEETGQMFALSCDNLGNDDQSKRQRLISHEIQVTKVDIVEEGLSDELVQDKVLQMFLCDGVVDTKERKDSIKNQNEVMTTEAKVLRCGAVKSWGHDNEALVAFAHPFRARARSTEMCIRIGDIEEPILALVDHGSEINILSRKIYDKGKWLVDINHGWVLKAANNKRGSLYGACPTVPIKVGDVEVEQNFFVQNQGSYPIILE